MVLNGGMSQDICKISAQSFYTVPTLTSAAGKEPKRTQNTCELLPTDMILLWKQEEARHGKMQVRFCHLPPSHYVTPASSFG